MLYDPKWETKTKADPISLAGLITWLENQPANRAYAFYCQTGSCLLDRYLTSVTGQPSEPSFLHFTVCGGHNNYYAIAQHGEWTFGAALERARKIQNRQSQAA